MIKFSDNQKLAYSTIDKNVCVNAGAGTGKTEVVSERFRYMYENGIDIKSIVCITFTNKAADEMKDRIIQKLNNPRLIDDINVSTISSFCKKIVSDNSYYLSIDPSFQIIEDDQANKMINEIFDKILENRIDFIKKLGNVLDISYTDTLKIIRDSFNKLRTNNIEFEVIKRETILQLTNLRNIDDEDIIGIKSYLFDLREESDNIKGLTKNSRLYKFLHDDKQNLEITEYTRFLLESFENLGESKKENVQEIIDEINKRVDAILSNKEKQYVDLYEGFFDILIEINREYSTTKNEKSFLDFNDIEIMCKKALENENILKSCKEKYKYFMIDEYQDTSNLQRDIFYMLCSDKEDLDRNNLFVVGDPKQAIYSFRGANIKVFENTREDIRKSGGKDITFYENHRTHPNIMEPINYIYSNKMKDRYDSLVAVNEIGDVIGRDEFKLNNKDAKTKDDSADILVSYINEDNFKDTAILARTKNDFSEYEKSLNNRNIPYYIFDKQGLEECREILNLIQFIKYARYDDEISKVGILSNVYDVDYNEILNQTEKYQSTMKKIVEQVQNFTENLTKYTIYDSLSNYIEQIDYLGLFSELQAKANVIKFLEIAKQFDSNNYSIEDFVDYFENNTNLYQMYFEDEHSDLVKLMTIHKSKGLGFDKVIVDNLSKPSINKDKFLLFMDNENIQMQFVLDFPFSKFRMTKVKKLIEEEEDYEVDNVYYTAFTRAKKELSFSNSKKSGHFKQISPYIEDLQQRGSIKFLELNERPFILEKIDTKFDKIEPKKVEIEKLIPIGITSILNSIEEVFDSNLEQSSINYILLGNLVHMYAKLSDGVNYPCIKEVDFLNKDEKKIFDVATKNFNQLITDFSNYKNEMDFNLLYENLMISGFMDRVEFCDEEIKVYDYKISSQSKEYLYEKYHMQLKFYSYVLNKKYNKNIKMVLVNLRKGYIIEKIYDKNCEQEVEVFLNNYLNQLN
ncbi:UvrD-helicase domain-containing protein [Finegoldia magna]|uniref:UvrD-helicase domain-containing protein n=1 Tax=Finegoldia magna TaxID=1260 RepID=UPI000B9169FD|nr:UvrD-helicase domain-containing protein [Finegoldia magna]MDU1010221.1 UvrD-helicase domain-containing protein [Finegoldia magna]MDU7890776.1 UvrD-helicase domain-containing protein [Finegoldia magna]OXZ39043.1 ATP-dependent exonuclease [Finegoldia magna]